MAIEHWSRERAGGFKITDLNGVTSATNGSGVFVRDYKDKTVWINVSVNTGAVTVTIQASPDNTNWYDLATKTYTASTAKDIFCYTDQFHYMRTKTTTQSNATVTTIIEGRG